MGSSKYHLAQAENEADSAAIYRGRASRALSGIRWARCTGWGMYGGSVGAAVGSTVTLLQTGNWVIALAGVVVGAALIPLKRLIIPKRIAKLEPLVKTNEEEASKHAAEAEREMSRYDLAKWREDFNALLPTPTPKQRELTRDERLYGTHYSQGLHAESARATQKAFGQFWERQALIEAKEAEERRREAAEVARKTDAARRARYNNEHRMVEITNRHGEREWVTVEEARRINSRKGRNEVVDLTDWQGDEDPRRRWADDRCEVCGEQMGNRMHTSHVKRNGRWIMVLDEATGTYGREYRTKLSTGAIHCSGCETDFTVEEFSNHLEACSTRRVAKGQRPPEVISKDALIIEQENDPRSLAQQVMDDLNGLKLLEKAHRLRCEVCGQYMTVGGPNSTASKHAHGRKKGGFSVTA